MEPFYGLRGHYLVTSCVTLVVLVQLDLDTNTLCPHVSYK